MNSVQSVQSMLNYGHHISASTFKTFDFVFDYQFISD